MCGTLNTVGCVAWPVPPVDTDHPVVLFDGVCNLCNWGVRFVIRRDPAGEFRFAPLQSAPAADLLEDCGLDPGQRDTWVLVDDGDCYTKSDAAVRVAARLGGGVGLLSALRYVPRPIRDLGYDLVAASRYRIFGRREECMVPTGDVADRFLVGDGRPNEPPESGDTTDIHSGDA